MSEQENLPEVIQGIMLKGASRALIEYTVKALGPKAEGLWREIGNWAGWEQDNTRAVLEEFFKMVNPLGIENPREVPPKISRPILRNAAVEENLLLREKYAALLANASNPEFQQDVDPYYPGLLSRLTPDEVKLLDYTFDKKPSEITLYEIGEVTGDQTTMGIKASKLLALGLVEPALVTGTIEGDREFLTESKLWRKMVNNFRLTPLGGNFVFACKKPQVGKTGGDS